MILRTLAPLLLAATLACSSASVAPGGTDAGADDVAATAPDLAIQTGDSALAEASATDTWQNYAATFFKTYCVACHNAQDPTGRDFDLQSSVENSKLGIRCGVAVSQDPSWKCSSSIAAKQFPIGTGPKPSDAERTRLVAWVTAGAP
jgi:hypothetical protein